LVEEAQARSAGLFLVNDAAFNKTMRFQDIDGMTTSGAIIGDQPHRAFNCHQRRSRR